MAFPSGGYLGTGPAIADGLIHYWPMDELAGTVVADSIGTMDGVVNNDVADATIVAGLFDNGRKLDAINDFIEIAAGGGTETHNAWSFSGWFYVAATLTATGTLFNLNELLGSPAPNTGMYLRITNQDLVAVQVNSAGGYNVASGISSLSLAAWNHVAVSYDRTTGLLSLWLNGALASSLTNTYTSDHSFDTNRSYIGTFDNIPGSLIKDEMDDYAFWDRSLVLAEIVTIYNAGAGTAIINPNVVEESITEIPNFIEAVPTSGLHFLITQALNVIEATPTPGFQIAGAVVEAPEFSETRAGTLTIGAVITESADVPDSVPVNQNINEVITDAPVFTTTFTLNGETYTGVVINTANFVGTKYTAYDFNSLCRFNGSHFGAKDDGVYLLEGSDDAGVDIAAHFLTGITDFQTDAEKRVMKAYLGARNDGTIVLKTVTTDAVDGLKRERWYEVTDTSTGIRKTRIKMGRGVKAAYWQFEIANKDGSDFELDLLDLVPIILTRRI